MSCPGSNPDVRRSREPLCSRARLCSDRRGSIHERQSTTAVVKFGRIKRQHGRIDGLDEILDRIAKECPHVTRIVPGRIRQTRGNPPARFRVQYPTGRPATGLKCLYSKSGAIQEVFLVCADVGAARQWLAALEL